MLGRVDGVTLGRVDGVRGSDALLSAAALLPSRVDLDGTARSGARTSAGDQEVYGALSECGGGVV